MRIGIVGTGQMGRTPGVRFAEASNEAAARRTVQQPAEELGLVGVDSGGLARSWLLEAAADLLRLQIGPMGLGGSATLSVHVLPVAR